MHIVRMLKGTVGERITDLRKQRNITMTELSARSGVSLSLLSTIENGKRGIGTSTLMKLSEELGVSTDFILGRTDERAPEYDYEKMEIRFPVPLAGEIKRISVREQIAVEELVNYVLRAYVDDQLHQSCVAAGG